MARPLEGSRNRQRGARTDGPGPGDLHPASPPHALVPRTWERRWAALLLAAGLLAYANSLSGPFIYDDVHAIVENVQIRQLWPLSVPLSPPAQSPVGGRPLVNLSLALNYAMGGLDVTGYHLANITVHLLCALLLFGIVRRTLILPALSAQVGADAQGLAFACSLIWVLHPLQTESVDFVTQRSESLMTLCYLLTLYATIRGRLWLAVLSSAAGMACKESMVTAPVLVFMYDSIFLAGSARAAMKQRWRFYLALAATWTVLAALMWSGPRAASVGFSTGVSPWIYLLNQTAMIVQYLRLAVWPTALVLDYGMTPHVTLADVWPYAAVMVALLAASLAAMAWRATIGFLLLSFFILLAPTSSVVPIATEVGAERRMYLPLAAVVMLAVLIAWHYLQRIFAPAARRVPAITLLVLTCGALTFATFERNREYRSGLAMAQTLLDRRPHGRAHGMMAEYLMVAGRRDEAVEHLRAGAVDYPLARFGLGQQLFVDGHPDEAIVQLRQFIAEAPTLVQVPPAYEMIGRALVQLNRLDEAAAEFRTILRIAPSYAAAHRRLGDVFNSQHRLDDAAAEYAAFLRTDPDDFDVLTRMGIVQSLRGHHDEAVRALQHALTLQPSAPTAHANLANAFLNQQDFAGAEREARETIRLNPGDAVAYELCGLALMAQGRLAEARDYFLGALKIDPSYAPARDHLARLRSGI